MSEVLICNGCGMQVRRMERKLAIIPTEGENLHFCLACEATILYHVGHGIAAIHQASGKTELTVRGKEKTK